jgi:hypothetical protein
LKNGSLSCHVTGFMSSYKCMLDLVRVVVDVYLHFAHGVADIGAQLQFGWCHGYCICKGKVRRPATSFCEHWRPWEQEVWAASTHHPSPLPLKRLCCAEMLTLSRRYALWNQRAQTSHGLLSRLTHTHSHVPSGPLQRAWIPTSISPRIRWRTSAHPPGELGPALPPSYLTCLAKAQYVRPVVHPWVLLRPRRHSEGS